MGLDVVGVRESVFTIIMTLTSNTIINSTGRRRRRRRYRCLFFESITREIAAAAAAAVFYGGAWRGHENFWTDAPAAVFEHRESAGKRRKDVD